LFTFNKYKIFLISLRTAKRSSSGTASRKIVSAEFVPSDEDISEKEPSDGDDSELLQGELDLYLPIYAIGLCNR
jgi:hypothetical protein